MECWITILECNLFLIVSNYLFTLLAHLLLCIFATFDQCFWLFVNTIYFIKSFESFMLSSFLHYSCHKSHLIPTSLHVLQSFKAVFGYVSIDWWDCCPTIPHLIHVQIICYQFFNLFTGCFLNFVWTFSIHYYFICIKYSNARTQLPNLLWIIIKK